MPYRLHLNLQKTHSWMRLFHPIILACHVYCVSRVAITLAHMMQNSQCDQVLVPDPLLRMVKLGFIVEKYLIIVSI